MVGLKNGTVLRSTSLPTLIAIEYQIDTAARIPLVLDIYSYLDRGIGNGRTVPECVDEWVNRLGDDRGYDPAYGFHATDRIACLVPPRSPFPRSASPAYDVVGDTERSVLPPQAGSRCRIQSHSKVWLGTAFHAPNT